MELRVLTARDEERLETFLAAHRDTSMFLRSNARRAGLVYEGAAFQALYVAAFEGDRLAGVSAHAWNGLMLIQAPEGPAAVETIVRACAERSGRKVTGFSGPRDQVTVARATLGLADAPAAVDGCEWLYAMDLTDIVVPPALQSGAIVCRPPRPDERDLLCDWRFAYDIETLGSPDSEETRQRSTAFLDTQIADGDAWVATDAATDPPVLLSLSAFNATLPDIVQLGGIYTPPALRGRGYAKAAVAHSLLRARERGASRAVLFTDNPSAARSYEAVGFRRTGDYSLVLLS
jgi:RimJ/RimL family protein N-acetyltransferase